jgi:hypothetical protein
VGGSFTAPYRVIGNPAAALVVAGRPVQINVRPRRNRGRRRGAVVRDGAGLAHGEKDGGRFRRGRHGSAPGRQRGFNERGGGLVEEEEALGVGYSGWVLGGGR